MLLPPYAAFFAASLLDDRGRQRCVGLFLALVVLSVLVGVTQVGSAGGALNFYNSAHRGNLLGFFANRTRPQARRVRKKGVRIVTTRSAQSDYSKKPLFN